MALIICTECGKEFSDRAKECPNCGCPTEDIIIEMNKDSLDDPMYKEVAKEESSLENKGESKQNETTNNNTNSSNVHMHSRPLNTNSKEQFAKEIETINEKSKGILNNTKKTGLEKTEELKTDCKENTKNIKSKNLHKNIKIAIVLIIILALLSASFYAYTLWSKDRFSWGEIHLANILPEPESSKGEIYLNEKENLHMDVFNISQEEFDEYINRCITAGFDIDGKLDEDSYTSYNQNGYNACITYDNNEEIMTIEIGEPMELGDLNWPSEGMAALLPKPNTNIGTIEKNDDASFEATVGDIPINELDEYIQACDDYGFNKKIESEDNTYKAQNEDGYRLNIKYIGFHTIEIDIKEPIYTVKLNIKCKKNLLLNQYDLDVYCNDEYETSISHGGKEITTINLKKGSYKLQFKNVEDDSVTGEISFDVNKNRMHRFVATCGFDEVKIKEIPMVKPPVTNDELDGKKYKEIVALYKDAGFNNVTTKKIKKVTPDNKELNGTVKSISIRNKTDFTFDDEFFIDRKVVIKYYAMKDIEVPSDSSDLKDMSFDAAINELMAAGFVNVKEGEYLTTTSKSSVGNVAEVSINGDTYFSAGDKYPINANIVVRPYRLDEEFYAQQQFEKWGKKQYPYGFKCHWFIGLINSEKYDNGWFLKVDVTVKDAFGNKYDGVAEGVVTDYGVEGFWVNIYY